MKRIFLILIAAGYVFTSCHKSGSNHALFGDPQKHHNEVNHHKKKFKKEPGSHVLKEDKELKKQNLQSLKDQKKAEAKKRKELKEYSYSNNSINTTYYKPPKKKE
ncbi:MAG: hypothetical protein K2X86_01875 [Cytophagaceae bacterium]|nr:hypothetical protein [Cytophagaceae bacterium]